MMSEPVMSPLFVPPQVLFLLGALFIADDTIK